MSEIIKTSESGWFIALAKAYKEKRHFILQDDLAVGIDPSKETIVQMGTRAGIGFNDWIAVIISLGVAAAGAYLLVMAILDPEPFSKIGLVLGSGVVLILGGGLTAVKVLTNTKPPKVKVGPNGIEISW